MASLPARIIALWRRPIVLIPSTIGAVAGFALAWWLASPLFISQTVEEEFPMAAKAEVPSAMTRAQVEKTMEEAAATDHAMDETMPAASLGSVAAKRGSFKDADSFHRGEGTAIIYRLADGSLVLRLDSFNVTNGPDLHVLLAKHPNPQESADVHREGYLDLGRLKGNIGSQNYPVPAEADVGEYGAVVIYCLPFQVVFSVASLEYAR